MSQQTNRRGKVRPRRAQPRLEGLESRQLMAVISGGVYLAYTSQQTPLVNRTVYVDVKNDGRLDAGDPSGITNANGIYAISGVPGGSFNLRVLPYPGDSTSLDSVTVTASQSLQAAPLTLAPGSAALPLTYNTSRFGTNNLNTATAEVTGLYKIILGRAPDTAGLSTWVGGLNSGGTASQLAAALLASTEYLSSVVSADYQAFVGRAGSAAEISALGLLATGRRDRAADDVRLPRLVRVHHSTLLQHRFRANGVRGHPRSPGHLA